MKELVEVIAKSLVDNPDEVEVTEKESGKALVLELKVAPSDMGKVIGRRQKSNCGYFTVNSSLSRKQDQLLSQILLRQGKTSPKGFR